ncbi:hypothetical protein ANSO36C_57630 [Nostoc cf. commune SO-36]|uniref:Transposase n=1 Tax=Nostoc cf. commune SO-36 TaxID=449208 RepID=A0ABN6QCI6_NOSCO|nr:transposase [Nostoc commune]BDI19961.1 hypothetical protein ANSO36C_57630 [Nostoc cf. commune SO-36]
MAKSKTLSFITEVKLKVSGEQERELLARFQAGRQLYNNCLNEAIKRMELLKNSDAYKKAKKMPKGKSRTDTFKEARKQYRYSEYDLHSYAAIVAKESKWIALKIDSTAVQKLATRAFAASEKVLFGIASSVRYKVPRRFRSIEGKSNKTGIRWKDNQLVWGNFVLDAIVPEDDLILSHGLNSLIKYVRILWRELNGKRRWFAQLVCEGQAFVKPQNYISSGAIGVDLNVSNVALVAENQAGLLPFAESFPTFEREIKAIQRSMERSRRTANPDNYNPDSLAKKGNKVVKKKGTIKKGKCKWSKSQKYLRLARKKRELERRKTAYIKSQNRRLVNEILRHGKHIKTENVSVKGWQKRYGKAIGAKSPGFFMSELIRKAENADGLVIKFSCQKTALSQTHLDGTRYKKSLSDRVHYDVTGIRMHRDLFSAFLARYVDRDTLLLHSAQVEWKRLEPILMEAWELYQQRTSRVGESESKKFDPSFECVSIDSGVSSQIANTGRKATGIA